MLIQQLQDMNVFFFILYCIFSSAPSQKNPFFASTGVGRGRVNYARQPVRCGQAEEHIWLMQLRNVI